MPSKLPEKEAQRRLKALEETKTKGFPNGSITKASQKLGDISPSALSRWLLQHGVKAGREPGYSREECIAELRRLTTELGRPPTRDEFRVQSPMRNSWRTYWADIGSFIVASGLESEVSGRERQRYQDRIKELDAKLRTANRELNELEDARKAIFNLFSEPVHIPAWSLFESRASADVELPMLFASDWQYGEVISKDRIGGFNEFNPRIANDRIRLLVSKAIELSFVHRGKKKYPGIYYLRGGDMISGEIHDDLRESNALQSGSSAREFVQIEAWAIRELTKAFGKVHVKSVPGNHGRTTEKPRSKWDVGDNFDVLTHYWLEDVFRGNDKISFDAPPSGDALFQVYGYQFCMTHGDRIGSSGGQGFLGAVATIMRGMKKTFDYYATLGTIIDYIFVGHFHTALQLEYGLSNGSLPGPSEYAKGFRMRPQAPQQWLLYVHPEFGVCDTKAVLLGPRPQIASMSVGEFA